MPNLEQIFEQQLEKQRLIIEREQRPRAKNGFHSLVLKEEFITGQKLIRGKKADHNLRVFFSAKEEREVRRFWQDLGL